MVWLALESVVIALRYTVKLIVSMAGGLQSLPPEIDGINPVKVKRDKKAPGVNP